MGFDFLLEGVSHRLTILARRPHLVVAVDGRAYRVEDPGEVGDGVQILRIDGTEVPVARLVEGTALSLRTAGRSWQIDWRDGAEAAGGQGDLSELRAPMPGAVIEVHAAAGETVAAGAPLVTIESMKLQTVLVAPRAGVLAEMPCAPGTLFGKDDILARLVAEETKDA